MNDNDTLFKMSKLFQDYSNISLEHTKLINQLLDIAKDHKERIIYLEYQAREREADCKLNYAKMKSWENTK